MKQSQHVTEQIVGILPQTERGERTTRPRTKSPAALLPVPLILIQETRSTVPIVSPEVRLIGFTPGSNVPPTGWQRPACGAHFRCA